MDYPIFLPLPEVSASPRSGSPNGSSSPSSWIRTWSAPWSSSPRRNTQPSFHQQPNDKSPRFFGGGPPPNGNGGGPPSDGNGGPAPTAVENLFLLPLQDQVVFPGQRFGLSIGPTMFERICRHCDEWGQNCIGLVSIKGGGHGASAAALAGPSGSAAGSSLSRRWHSPERGKTTNESDHFGGDHRSAVPELYRIGTYCRLLSQKKAAGSVVLAVMGKSRMRIETVGLNAREHFGVGRVILLTDPAPELQQSVELRGLVVSVQEVLRR